MADCQNIRRVIQLHFDRIENELNARAISGKLFSEDVIGYTEKQKINSKDNPKESNIVLANYLYEAADRAKLERFLAVLESDDGTYPRQKSLAKDMRAHLSVGS